METMAIIAYHQPVTRAEIEDIRGVAVAKGTVDTLLEAGWIKPRGRKQTPGRPLMWGTTDAFLDHFGLSTVKELPGMDELKAAGLLDKRENRAGNGRRRRSGRRRHVGGRHPTGSSPLKSVLANNIIFAKKVVRLRLHC